MLGRYTKKIYSVLHIMIGTAGKKDNLGSCSIITRKKFHIGLHFGVSCSLIFQRK